MSVRKEYFPLPAERDKPVKCTKTSVFPGEVIALQSQACHGEESLWEENSKRISQQVREWPWSPWFTISSPQNTFMIHNNYIHHLGGIDTYLHNDVPWCGGISRVLQGTLAHTNSPDSAVGITKMVHTSLCWANVRMVVTGHILCVTKAVHHEEAVCPLLLTPQWHSIQYLHSHREGSQETGRNQSKGAMFVVINPNYPLVITGLSLSHSKKLYAEKKN